MRASAPPLAVTATAMRRPLFGGYVLVAVALAWIAGIALSGAGPLVALPGSVWLALAAISMALCIAAGFASRRLPSITTARIAAYALAGGVLLCALALGAARATFTDPAATPDAVSRLAHGQSVLLRGVVATEPDLRAGFRLLTVDASEVSADGGHTWAPASGRVEATVFGPDDWFAPAYGDSVTLSGTLAPADGASPPGVLARMGGARATVGSRGNGNPLFAALFDLRVRLAAAIQHSLPEPEAALLIGILLGLKTPALRARLPLFTATGTIHLVVPAGLKVSTLAELASRGARQLGRWPRTVAALLAVGGYAALGGGGPAAVRAAIMGALLVLAPALGRAYNVYTALALAALLMAAVEPLVIYDAGFQLTTLATFGLPLLVPPIARRLALWLRWLPLSAAIAESLAVTVAAQLATLPVLALTFGQVSLVAPLANLLAVPLLAPLLVLGGLLALAGALLGAVGTALALVLAWIVWPLLWYVDALIALCANLPGAALAVSNAPALAAWGYYAALVAVVWWLVRRSRGAGTGAAPASVTATSVYGGHARLTRGALAALLALTLLGACGAAAPAVAMRDARLAFLDVGPGGEAALLRLPSGATALLNGGPDGPRLEAALAGQLPFWQRTLDVAVLSDPRPGDARGVEDAAAHFAIGRVADAGMTHPSADYLAYLDGTRRAGAARTQIRQGNVIHLDAETSLRVLAPPTQLYPAGEGSTTASNDLILRLETPGLRALFLGAADAYALDALADAGEPLAADVVELALPEGAPLDLDGPLGTVLRLAHPRLVVIASAPIPPRSAAAQRAATLYPWDTDADAATALGALIYRVDAAGTLVVSGGARGWAIG